MSSAEINDRISDYSLSVRRMMGCASSQAGNLPPGHAGTEKTKESPSSGEASAKYPPAEAFEISLDDVDNDNDDRSDSLIKKHPPKRLQKLVEQAATAVPPTTIEHLEEKLAKAEVRRQQYIQQRIDNIITLTAKGGGASGSPDADADGDGDGGGNDQNDGHNDGGNASVDGKAVIVASSRDADADADVVQPTPQLNETAVSANENIQTDGDHVADNRTHS